MLSVLRLRERCLPVFLRVELIRDVRIVRHHGEGDVPLGVGPERMAVFGPTSSVLVVRQVCPVVDPVTYREVDHVSTGQQRDQAFEHAVSRVGIRADVARWRAESWARLPAVVFALDVELQSERAVLSQSFVRVRDVAEPSEAWGDRSRAARSDDRALRDCARVRGGRRAGRAAGAAARAGRTTGTRRAG